MTLALLLLKRRRNAAVRNGALMRLAPLKVANNVHRTVEGGILEIRKLARLGGVERLGKEFESIGVPLGTSRAEAKELLRDAHRASRAGKSYAAQWQTAAQEHGARNASEVTDHAIERTAITEASEAYNSGRLTYLDGVSADVFLYRVWDSAFDTNTCVICAGADGEMVPIGESFPEGEPGDVHPRCLCSWHVIESRSELIAA